MHCFRKESDVQLNVHLHTQSPDSIFNHIMYFFIGLPSNFSCETARNDSGQHDST